MMKRMFTVFGVLVFLLAMSACDSGGGGGGSSAVFGANPPSARILSNPSMQAQVGQLYRYDVTTTGIPEPIVTASGMPNWLIWNEAGQYMLGVPGPQHADTSSEITVIASNANGDDAIQTFRLNVGDGSGTGGVDTAPMILSNPVTQTEAGKLYIYPIIVSGYPSPSITISGLPMWLTLNGSTLSGTPSDSDVGVTGEIRITAANGIPMDDVQSFTITVIPNSGGPTDSPPQIGTTAPTTATVGIPYNYVVMASGQPSPSFSASGLPAWLTFSGATLSGTPGMADIGTTGQITITATNGIAPDDSETFSITVMAAQQQMVAPQITSIAPIFAQEGQLYSYTITATGTPAPTFMAANLPTWLSFAGDTLSGTPGAGDVGQTQQITLTATNGVAPDADQNFMIDVIAIGGQVPPQIISTPPTVATVGQLFSYDVVATGTPAPTIMATNLPAWLSLVGNTLSGTPMQADVGPVPAITLTASNGVGSDDTQILNITVAAAALAITNASLPDAMLGATYSETLTATGGAGGYVFTISNGALPPGLSISGDMITGTPSSATGSPFSFTVQVEDSATDTATKAFTIAVQPMASLGTWTDGSSTNAPAVRRNHTAVWTGTEMIIWGGQTTGLAELNDGARYDPMLDSWTPISTTGAPSARHSHCAVWTGSEMVIWGGSSLGAAASTGASYNPTTDTWTLISQSAPADARVSPSYTFVGDFLIAWGGQDNMGQALNNGVKYNVRTDTWTSIAPMSGQPDGSSGISLVADGNEVLLFGGRVSANASSLSGNRLDLSNDSFTALAAPPFVGGVDSHAATMVGGEMFIWGGTDAAAGVQSNAGAIYDPLTDSWTSISTTAAPSPRINAFAADASGRLLIWGGMEGSPLTPLANGGLYDAGTDTWSAIASANAPSERFLYSAIWTGTQMIVFGGRDAGGVFSNETKIYTP